MARENTQNTNQTNKAPDYLAWHVTKKDEKSYWNKVGRGLVAQGWTWHQPPA